MSARDTDQPRLSSEALDALAAEVNAAAAPGNPDFREKCRTALQKVDKLNPADRPLFVISLAAPKDTNVQADAARLKLLREAIESLIHLGNSSHLERTMRDLNQSTERLEKWIVRLTVVLVFLTVVLIALTARLAPEPLPKEWIVGLGVALVILTAVPLAQPWLQRRAASRQSESLVATDSR